jgi:nicotinamidase-related amidase
MFFVPVVPCRTRLKFFVGEREMNPYREFLNREDCILLLVDIQKVMLDPCEGKDRLVMNAGGLMAAAELFKIPIIFSEHNAEKLGGFLPELTGKVSAPTILNKLEFSCFQNEGLARAMARTGRRTLLLAGLETHVCIFHTGADALRLGYTVHVAADAVASRSGLNREVGLRRLEQAGAVNSSTEMMVYELLERCGTEEFRAALPLLKTL